MNDVRASRSLLVAVPAVTTAEPLIASYAVTAGCSGGAGARCVTLYALHSVLPKLKPLIAPFDMSKLTLPPAVCTFSMTVRPLPARFRSKLPVPLKFGWLAGQRRDQRLERDAARAAVEREAGVVARGAHVEITGERAAVEPRSRVLELRCRRRR